MWQKKLDELQQEKKVYHEDINTGADIKDIDLLTKSLKQELDVELPQEYMDLLRKVNGLEFNGFIFYGIDEGILEYTPKQHITGILDANKIWYENEPQKKYLFIGESNISWYVYKKDSQEYLELDNPSGRILTKYNSLNELLYQFLSDSLI